MLPRQWFAVGDPQTSRSRFFSFLDAAGLRGGDGRLRPDVGLVSIGDHFDYGADPDEAAVEGTAILRWLAGHPADQVVLIAGNHDLSRVTELAFETDASFAEARDLARRIGDSPKAGLEEFVQRFPRIPTPELALRDYAGFRVEQRALVQELLLSHRFVLGAATTLGPTPALLVHAGISTRELAILGLPDERAPRALAAALNAWLYRAVDQVERAWRRGELAALALEPLHVAGGAGREGGGLLYHRPVNVHRAERKETAEALSPERPRRFPVENLPRDLLQIVGHTAHKRSREELSPWVSARALSVERGGGTRTLRFDATPSYDLGVLEHRPGSATMVMIDGGMSDERVAKIDLLPIGAPEL